MNPLYPFVALRAGQRCEYCHAPAAVVNFPLEVEHVLPISSGGDDSPDNLALSCRSCNAFKGIRRQGTDPVTQANVPLFHPRRDVWEEHFFVAPQADGIVGKTPTGRATITLLQMNSPEQLLARRYWRQMGLFP